MPKLSVFNMGGKAVGEIKLSDFVFAIKPNVDVLHEMIINHLANRRQGTKSTLTRSEVSGGGRKPWRQKGTGRARQGSTRSPQWRHGGVVFAPKPRDYSYTVNKKVKRLAMKSALSTKLLQNDIIIIDKIETKEYKTRIFVDMLEAIKADKKVLMVLNKSDKKVVKSTNNIPAVKTLSVDILNVYDILNSKKLVLSYDAVVAIQEVYV